MNRPEDLTDDQINALVERGEIPDPRQAVPELFFTTKRRHRYVFEPHPVGTDMGWVCYDDNKFDGVEDITRGYGLTKDAAYVDYLEQVDR